MAGITLWDPGITAFTKRVCVFVCVCACVCVCARVCVCVNLRDQELKLYC